MAPGSIRRVRRIFSAPRVETAAAGMGSTPSGKMVTPVCGTSSSRVVMERTMQALAPNREAIAGPRVRWSTALP